MVRGLNTDRRNRILSSPKGPDRLCGPPSLLFKAYRCSVAGIKRPEREVGHLPPLSDEVKDVCCYTSVSQVFMPLTGIALPFFVVSNGKKSKNGNWYLIWLACTAVENYWQDIACPNYLQQCRQTL
jgi:hypothetical protein